jgi:hypothetical protein
MLGNGHRFALAFAAIVIAGWGTALGLVIATAAPQGRALALFPFGTSPDQAVAAIVRSGGRPIGRRWIVWAIATDADGARRLRAEGALAILPDLPFATALGCAGYASRVDPLDVSRNAF